MTSNSMEHQENLGPPTLSHLFPGYCKHICTHETIMSILAQHMCIWTPTPFNKIRLQIAYRLCFCFFPDHIWKQIFILVPPPQSFVMVAWSNSQQIFPPTAPLPSRPSLLKISFQFLICFCQKKKKKKHQHEQRMYMSPCTASQSPVAGLWSQRVNDCSSVSFVWLASMGCLMVRAHLPGTKLYLFLPDLSTSLLSNVQISANSKSEK